MFALRQCNSNSVPAITVNTNREKFLPCKAGCLVHCVSDVKITGCLTFRLLNVWS